MGKTGGGGVTIDAMAEQLQISHGSRHHIIHEEVLYGKVSVSWVPKQINVVWMFLKLFNDFLKLKRWLFF